MPTYEYECSDCSNRIEVFQSFSDAPLTSCEACGGKLKKVFHPAGIIFKGSGWYATDSRSASERKKFKNDGKPPEKSDSKPVKTDGAKSNGSATDGGAKAGSVGGRVRQEVKLRRQFRLAGLPVAFSRFGHASGRPARHESLG